MRAIICDSFGPIEALRIGDMPEPVPHPGEVLIDVRCAGASFADGLVVQGKHIARPPFPFVPGAEVAGVVVSVGGDVVDCAIGDRVMAFAARGAFAERIVVAATRVFPLPDGVSFPDGAASLVSYGTAIHALTDRGRLRAGETLLVLGAAGSTGLAAVEVGRLLGARVIAAASTAEKRALVISRGAAVAIDYVGEGFRAALRDAAPEGIDVAFDPVGGPAGETLVRAFARGGRHLIVGFAAGTIPQLAANLYLVKQAEALGILWGEPRTLAEQRANIARITDWLATGALRPTIGGTWPLERCAQALLAVAGRGVAGKALIAIGAGS